MDFGVDVTEDDKSFVPNSSTIKLGVLDSTNGKVRSVKSPNPEATGSEGDAVALTWRCVAGLDRCSHEKEELLNAWPGAVLFRAALPTLEPGFPQPVSCCLV